jgi:hypothetical protein
MHSQKLYSNENLQNGTLVERSLATGLPDGLFSNQKFQFELVLEGLRCENVDVFYGHLEHLEYFMTIKVHDVFIWYILFRFWYYAPRKIWQPCLATEFVVKIRWNSVSGGNPIESSLYDIIVLLHFQPWR